MKYPAMIVLVALGFAACNSSETFPFSGDLKVGEPVKGTLAADTPDTFRLELAANTHLYGFADQLTVDVVVTLLDSVGAPMGMVDGPARGPEYFTFEVKKAGSYFLEVKPFEKESGDYSMELVRVEAIATDAGKRADQLFIPYSGPDKPGAVVGVIQDGKVLFSRACGMADLTFSIPYEVFTPSNIGSLSKQFTAMAILLLEKDGKLSLEDDVRKHLPELPDLGQKVSLRNMLNHTNGFREVYNLMPMTGWKGEDVLLRGEVLEILKRQKELQAAPGTEFNYNNSAFILLATIVERISGQSFPEFMEERVFAPLGMNSTMVRHDPTVLVPGASRGYVVDSAGFHQAGDLYASYGAGGIYTTVEDFSKWMGNFADPVVGDRELIARMVHRDTLNNGDTLRYGLGIGVEEVRGLLAYTHGGADIAHRAFLFYFPGLKGGAVAMSNNALFDAAHVAYEMAALFFGEEMEQAEKAKESPGEEGEETQAAEEGAEDALAEEGAEKVEVPYPVLESYAGDYMSKGKELVLSFSMADGVLKLTTEGQPGTRMVPITQTRFRYEGREAWIEFKKDAAGRITGAVHTQGGNDLECERVPPYEPGPEILQEYQGKYLSRELETFYTLELRDSTLVVLIRNTRPVKLDALEADLYKGDIYFLGELQFLRDAAGTITGFEASNGRTRGILFERF